MAGFTSKDFRSAVGSFATGVTVVTTRGEEHSYGMTANAFSSVSLDPPLILVCVMANSEGGGLIRENGVFAVNILAAHQEPLSRFFASKDRPRGRDAFSDVPHRTAVSGSPEAVASLLSNLPDGFEILGPVPVDEQVRALVRTPRSAGPELARALHAAQAARSARKEGGGVRVQLDPAAVI